MYSNTQEVARIIKSNTSQPAVITRIGIHRSALQLCMHAGERWEDRDALLETCQRSHYEDEMLCGALFPVSTPDGMVRGQTRAVRAVW